MLLPGTRKAHPAFEVAVYPGQQGKIPCQLGHSPDPSCVAAAILDLLRLLFSMETRGQNAHPKRKKKAPTVCAPLSLRPVALRRQSAERSREAEKAGEGPSHPAHMPSNGVTVLQELSRCS